MRREFLVFLVAVSLISSCKRNVTKEEEQPGPSSVIGKAQAWLVAQGQANSPYKDKIQALQDHVEWSMAREESYANRHLIVIPMKEGYLTTNNKGKDPSNYLVLFVNQKQEVTNGRIVQYVSKGVQRSIPEKAIVKILNNEDPGCEGSFTFTNIVDRFLYELKFSSGKKTDFVYMQPKAKNTQASERQQAAVCQEWWLITIHYNTDGTVEVWNDYLGTTCDCTPTGPSLEATLCDEFDSGGGGGGIAEECCVIASNAIFQSNSQSTVDNVSCGTEALDPATGKWTKTCTFTWTYNTSSLLWSTWSYISIEVGELEREGKQWLFKSFTHSGKMRDGVPPTCMEFSDEIRSATPSISADRKQARMDLAYSISAKPTCVPFSSVDIRTMNSYGIFYGGLML